MIRFFAKTSSEQHLKTRVSYNNRYATLEDVFYVMTLKIVRAVSVKKKSGFYQKACKKITKREVKTFFYTYTERKTCVICISNKANLELSFVFLFLKARL